MALSNSSNAVARANEMVNAHHVLEFERDGVGIAIDSMRLGANGGLDVFARAWRGKDQIGFGPDGSVDIERFHFGNPPLLVADVDGEINLVERKRKYRVDPKRALQEILSATILDVGKVGAAITPNKRGNTTFTLFSTNDALIEAFGSTFSNARAGSGTFSIMPLAGGCGQADTTGSGAGATRFHVLETALQFDASSVSGTVTAATASLYINDDFSDIDFTIEMRISTNGSPITSSDYIAGASLSGHLLAASLSTATASIGSYLALTSDATFPANIAFGVNQFNISSSRTRAANTPTTANNEEISFDVSATNTLSGTTSDPKLVIVTAATFTASRPILLNQAVKRSRFY